MGWITLRWPEGPIVCDETTELGGSLHRSRVPLVWRHIGEQSLIGGEVGFLARPVVSSQSVLENQRPSRPEPFAMCAGWPLRFPSFSDP